jgi:hypothetical protein
VDFNFVEGGAMDVQAAAEVQGVSEFSVELYQALLKINNNDDDEKVTNLVMSPLSIAITLAMALAGAKGATRKQIAQLLKLPQEGDPLHKFSSQLRSVVLADAGSEHGGGGGPLLKVANRVWVEQSLKLKPTFQKLLKNSFGSEAGSVDFIHEVGLTSDCCSFVWCRVCCVHGTNSCQLKFQQFCENRSRCSVGFVWSSLTKPERKSMLGPRRKPVEELKTFYLKVQSTI